MPRTVHAGSISTQHTRVRRSGTLGEVVVHRTAAIGSLRRTHDSPYSGSYTQSEIRTTSQVVVLPVLVPVSAPAPAPEPPTLSTKPSPRARSSSEYDFAAATSAQSSEAAPMQPSSAPARAALSAELPAAGAATLGKCCATMRCSRDATVTSHDVPSAASPQQRRHESTEQRVECVAVP